MELRRSFEAFTAAGFGVAALSVDAAERAARLRLNLRLPYPLLCDPGRDAIKAWGLYNPRERGGIAVPATAVVNRDGLIAFLRREAMASRLKPEELLAHLEQGTAAPAAKRFWPGWQDWWRALRR